MQTSIMRLKIFEYLDLILICAAKLSNERVKNFKTPKLVADWKVWWQKRNMNGQKKRFGTKTKDLKVGCQKKGLETNWKGWWQRGWVSGKRK